MLRFVSGLVTGMEGTFEAGICWVGFTASEKGVSLAYDSDSVIVLVSEISVILLVNEGTASKSGFSTSQAYSFEIDWRRES